MRYFIVRKDGWPAIVREDEVLDVQDLRPVAVCETREGALRIAEELTRRTVARRGTLARLRWALRSLMRGSPVAVVGGSSYRPSR